MFVPIQYNRIYEVFDFKFCLQAFADVIRDELFKFPEEVRDDVIILFSAHSLPMKVSSAHARLTPALLRKLNFVLRTTLEALYFHFLFCLMHKVSNELGNSDIHRLLTAETRTLQR